MFIGLVFFQDKCVSVNVYLHPCGFPWDFETDNVGPVRTKTHKKFLPFEFQGNDGAATSWVVEESNSISISGADSKGRRLFQIGDVFNSKQQFYIINVDVMWA